MMNNSTKGHKTMKLQLKTKLENQLNKYKGQIWLKPFFVKELDAWFSCQEDFYKNNRIVEIEGKKQYVFIEKLAEAWQNQNPDVAYLDDSEQFLHWRRVDTNLRKDKEFKLITNGLSGSKSWINANLLDLEDRELCHDLIKQLELIGSHLTPMGVKMG